MDKGESTSNFNIHHSSIFYKNNGAGLFTCLGRWYRKAVYISLDPDWRAEKYFKGGAVKWFNA